MTRRAAAAARRPATGERKASDAQIHRARPFEPAPRPDPAQIEAEKIQSHQEVRSWGVVYGGEGGKAASILLYLAVIAAMIAGAAIVAYVRL